MTPGSRNELRPREDWGPSLWAFVHTITVVDFATDATNAEHGARAAGCLRALADALPCPHCRAAYREALERLGSLPLERSMVLFRWGWELHNAVNAKLGRPATGYDAAVARWTRPC